MVATDEDALVCDFAETYHIYDWRALPLRYAATLAFGLSDNSRIKTQMSGAKCSLDTILLASAVDALNLLVWMQPGNVQSDNNRPQRIAPYLMGEAEEKESDFLTFNSIEEFEAARAEILGG